MSWWRFGDSSCLLGHACRIRKFNDEGLHFDGDIPCFCGFAGQRAGMKFFGLSRAQTSSLFFGTYWGMPAKEVLTFTLDELIKTSAKKIRKRQATNA
jgi:hypothetical protein